MDTMVSNSVFDLWIGNSGIIGLFFTFFDCSFTILLFISRIRFFYWYSLSLFPPKNYGWLFTPLFEFLADLGGFKVLGSSRLLAKKVGWSIVWLRWRCSFISWFIPDIREVSVSLLTFKSSDSCGYKVCILWVDVSPFLAFTFWFYKAIFFEIAPSTWLSGFKGFSCVY